MGRVVRNFADFVLRHDNGLSDEMGDLVPGLDFAQPSVPKTNRESDGSTTPLTDFEAMPTMRSSLAKAPTKRNMRLTKGQAGVFGKHGVKSRGQRTENRRGMKWNPNIQSQLHLHIPKETKTPPNDDAIDDVEEIMMNALRRKKFPFKVMFVAHDQGNMFTL